MDGTVPAKRPFPYANWGPGLAIAGVLLALATGFLFAVPVLLVDRPPAGDELSDTANALVQLATAAGFLLVPLTIALSRGAPTMLAAARRLGVRPFRPSAYLLLAIVYVALVGEPEQEDFAEDLGSVPVQVLLIVIAAPISEEVCFRGMLFGGLRERLPAVVAALIAGAVFGALHAATGVSAVPPLIGFGFILALLYEKTGSIVPGILLHMLNNSVALLGQ
jgi:membrane protease YdiL (CAAX protease family)